MSNRKPIIKRTLVYGVLLAVYITVLTTFDIHCPIAKATGIECPTCGVSRALLSLLEFNFKAYYNYNPLAVPLLVSVWLMLNSEYFKHKALARSVAIFTVSVNFILYLFEIFNLPLLPK